MKRNIAIFALIVLCLFTYVRQEQRNYYDMINAVSGATPLAVAKDVPNNISLTVDGLVEHDYYFSSSALNGFASTRIRAGEFGPKGEYLGAYAYVGIPVFNILEGIAPKKPDNAAFDQPMDILVQFTSSSGQSVYFGYSEIIMADDHSPITLAYYREPVQPISESGREDYDKNLFTSDLSGLRVIAPREPDVSRYLDDVVRITFTSLSVPDQLLPPRQKKKDCSSSAILCIKDKTSYPGSFEGVARADITDWTVIGHGYGFKKTVDVEGFDLRSFLAVNFPETKPSDFFLFVACDGYRGLFSGYEILKTASGAKMLIADTMDGIPTEHGFKLASTVDFFADRSLWGLSAVVRIRHIQ